jgi:hypothetical protein
MVDYRPYNNVRKSLTNSKVSLSALNGQTKHFDSRVLKGLFYVLRAKFMLIAQ